MYAKYLINLALMYVHLAFNGMASMIDRGSVNTNMQPDNFIISVVAFSVF